MTAVKVRKEKRSNEASERMAGITICRERRFCSAIPCIPARPPYRRCKERLRFGAPDQASAGMVHLKNHFQYLGPGNCSQLLKLMLFCNFATSFCRVLTITLLRAPTSRLLWKARPISSSHPSLCDLVSWGIAPENS